MDSNSNEQELTVNCGPANRSPDAPWLSVNGIQFPAHFNYHVTKVDGGYRFAINDRDGSEMIGVDFEADSLESAIGQFVIYRKGAGVFNFSKLTESI